MGVSENWVYHLNDHHFFGYQLSSVNPCKLHFSVFLPVSHYSSISQDVYINHVECNIYIYKYSWRVPSRTINIDLCL